MQNNVKIVFEDVETEDRVKFLRTVGTHFIRGYVYARPGAFSDLPDMAAHTA